MTKSDTASNRIKRNIEYLMKKQGISGVASLAKILDIPPTTIYSFLRNPLSNSKVKFIICNFFNISVDELENYDFSGTEITLNDKFDIKSNQSILSMSDDTIYDYLSLQSFNTDEIGVLKKSIKDVIYTNFRKCCGQAKICFKSEDYQNALYYISSAFWLLKPPEIKYITENDLALYIDIANQFNDNDLISSLIFKLESVDYFNYKILIVLANLLEEKFPNESKMCYEIIKNKGF